MWCLTVRVAISSATRDLLAREPACDEPEDLGFALGEARGQRAFRRRERLARGGEHARDCIAAQLARGGVGGERLRGLVGG